LKRAQACAKKTEIFKVSFEYSHLFVDRLILLLFSRSIKSIFAG